MRVPTPLENSKSKKGHNYIKSKRGLPPLLVGIPLLIFNNLSESQINIFSNDRDIRKPKFLQDDADAADDDRAMTIPRHFLRKQPSYM